MHQVIHIIHIPQDNISLPHLPLSFHPQDLYTYHKLANIDKNNPKMLDFSAFHVRPAWPYKISYEKQLSGYP